MRKLWQSLFIVLAFIAVRPALAQRGTFAAPAEAELNKFRVFKAGEMTTAMQAELGLRAVKLEDTVTVFNYFHDKGRFVLETLVRGTYVWVDKDDVLRYKADCTNRIVKASGCPKCREQIAALQERNAELTNDNAGLARMMDNNRARAEQPKSWFAGALDGLWDFLKFLLGVLMLILLIGAIVWLLREFWRYMTATREETPPIATHTPVVPVPVVPTPAVAPLAPALTIVLPTQREITLFYDGGLRIVMESRRRRGRST